MVPASATVCQQPLLPLSMTSGVAMSQVPQVAVCTSVTIWCG